MKGWFYHFFMISSSLFPAPLRHVARVMLAACFTLVWLAGQDYLFDYLPEKYGEERRAGVISVMEQSLAAIYTPAAWLDRLMGAWMDEPDALPGGGRFSSCALCRLCPCSCWL